MNFYNLNILIEILELIFEPEDLSMDELSKLDLTLNVLENKISEEISNNLFGKNFIEKEDLIKIYLEKIADVNYNIFIVNYDDADEDEVNKIILEKIKETYQFIINFICTTAIRNNIDIIKLSKVNNYISYLDLRLYTNEIKELNLEKGTNKLKLKSEFSSIEAYELFIYIIDNFNSSYSDHNKYSCIYRMMVYDGYISKDFRPEHFKRLIISEYKNIAIDFFLINENALSKKIIKHYQSLKSNYLSKNS